MKRCVITGMGAITPIGNDAPTFWENLKKGVCGIDYIKKFDASDSRIKVDAEIKDFDPEKYVPRKELKRNDMFAIYGVCAACQAYEMSGLTPETIDPYRFGVIVSSGIGGVCTMEEQIQKLMEKGPSKVSPLFVPMSIGNMAAGNIAIRMGAKGLCISVVTACATGTNSIGEAFHQIKLGKLDACLAGGTENAISRIAVAGFANLTALTTAEDPKRACIPFDKDRKGFVIADGAGVLMLEELEHAKARGAKIYGEIVGYGTTCDAYHITAPTPDGEGAARAMQLAMEEAGITPDQVSYINAHGTGTPANDVAETKAIKTALGEAAYHVPISSTKSMTGHLLGGAGGVEAVACAYAVTEDFIPPTIGLEHPDEQCDLDYVPKVGRNVRVEYALSNSLGFGGHNAVLCFKKWEE